MSAVLCLPACLRVSAAVSRGQAPNGNASKAFHRRGVTHPSRATRGRLNLEHHGLRSAARQQRRVREGGVATGTPTSAISFGRPAPAALPATSPTSTATPRTSPARGTMVNCQEAGKTWPLPHPHAVGLLRGLVWGQHYRHSNPQCEGGMPRSLEVRENVGADRLQAVEDWLRLEGYAYCFRQKRWRVWTRPDRPGEGLRPDGIEEDENPNEYPSGATINVSMWDMIEKKFL